jgi:hypothetical protein
LLKVDINSSASPDDPRKFKFTFMAPPAGAPTSEVSHEGESFYLNQSDLSRFEPRDGERKSAAEVAYKKPGKPFEENRLVVPRPMGEHREEGEQEAVGTETTKGGQAKAGMGIAPPRLREKIKPGAEIIFQGATGKPVKEAEVPRPAVVAQKPPMEAKKELAARPQIPGQAPPYTAEAGEPLAFAEGSGAAEPPAKKSRIGKAIIAAHAGVFGGIGLGAAATGMGSQDVVSGAASIIHYLAALFTS